MKKLNYLLSILDNRAKIEDGIDNRINKARILYNVLTNIWKSSEMSNKMEEQN